jgi:phosphate transport system ATP-binding protein
MNSNDMVITVKDLDLFYGEFQALKNVPMEVKRHHITALIGPSGCGKSTLLRTLNRMNDLIPSVRVTGSILLDGKNIYDSGMDVCALRKRVGMVFQRPNPFPLSIFDNVAFGLKVAGMTDRHQVTEIVERSLKGAA